MKNNNVQAIDLKIEKLKKVIQLSESKTILLKEYLNSIIYENCSHAIEINKDRFGHFLLIHIESKQIIFCGTFNEISKFCAKKKFPEETIFNFEKFKKS